MEKTSSQILIEKTEEPSKFLLVGLSGVFVNFVILFIFADILDFPAWIALAIAIFISMTSNYILNRIWTFKSQDKILQEYVRYLATNLLGAAIQYTITLSLFSYIGQDNLSIFSLFDFPSLYFSTGIGIVIGFIFNFALSKFFVFRNN